MNVLLNADGTRNRDFRPYIEEEELGNNLYLYDPNGPGFHYGLYDTAQPSCGSWLDIYYQYPSKTPAAVVSNTGRLHLVRPEWWRHGYHYYEPLMRNSRPT
jgi:hypothetical protein